MNTSDWLPFVEKQWQRRRKGCRWRVVGCLLLLLGLLLSCGLLAWLINPADAAASAAADDPLTVFLLIDNSNSMFEKGGVGSDPDLLRLEAARLFISYLGVDNSATTHQCSVIFFGSTAEVTVPLTDLIDEQQRAEIFARLADPPRMGWTDHVAALSLALEQLHQEQTNGRPAIILFTDGKPEWDNSPTPAEEAAYLSELQAVGRQMAEAGIPLFLILLANESTDADPDIAQVWQPTWQAIAEATPPGGFYTARQAEELVGIYHDIAVSLTGGRTAGSILQETVNPSGVERIITVEPNLLRLTLVIHKSAPAIAVTVSPPDTQPLTAATPGVRYAGRPGVTHEEIWVIDHPLPGQWIVQFAGEGQVTVWKDYQVLPVTPTQTLPTIAPTRTLIPPTLSAVATTLVTPSPCDVPIAHPLTLSLCHPAALPQATQTPLSVVAVSTFLAGQATTPADTADPPISPSSRRWLWLLLPGLLLFAVGGYSTWRLRGRSPIVIGTLHILSGRGADGQGSIELDAFNRQAITIGPATADIPLPESTGRASIRPGTAVGDTFQMLIDGSDHTFLDGEPLTAARHLHDSAVITIGLPPGPVHRLRYENLRLRAAEREWVTG